MGLFSVVEDADVSTKIQNNFWVLLFLIFCYKVSFKNKLMNVAVEKLEPLYKRSHPGPTYCTVYYTPSHPSFPPTPFDPAARDGDVSAYFLK